MHKQCHVESALCLDLSGLVLLHVSALSHCRFVVHELGTCQCIECGRTEEASAKPLFSEARNIGCEPLNQYCEEGKLQAPSPSRYVLLTSLHSSDRAHWRSYNVPHVMWPSPPSQPIAISVMSTHCQRGEEADRVATSADWGKAAHRLRDLPRRASGHHAGRAFPPTCIGSASAVHQQPARVRVGMWAPAPALGPCAPVCTARSLVDVPGRPCPRRRGCAPQRLQREAFRDGRQRVAASVDCNTAVAVTAWDVKGFTGLEARSSPGGSLACGDAWPSQRWSGDGLHHRFRTWKSRDPGRAKSWCSGL